MRVASVNVSQAERVAWRGKVVETGIFKKPVQGRVMVRRTNIDGDRQADRSVHGGEFKAVYAYSLTDLAWWSAELSRELPFGMFGENLTVDGLIDEEVYVGDVYRVGDAVLEAVQPRLPCFKLGIRFSDPEMVRHFLDAGRWGIYFRVLDEGALVPGDEMTLLRRGDGEFPVPELARLSLSARREPGMVARALSLPALPPAWREQLERDRRSRTEP